MKKIRIENLRAAWLLVKNEEELERLKKYLDQKGRIDVTSPEYKKASRTPLRNFSIEIRVSKLHEGKQRFKKQRYTYKDKTTLTKAIEELNREPARLLAELEQEIREGNVQRKKRISKATVTDAWDLFYEKKTTPSEELRNWKPTTARTYQNFFNKWIRGTRLGDTPIAELQKEDATDLIRRVMEKNTVRTATTAIEVLRPLVDWWYEENDIPRRNPVPKKSAYRFDNSRVVQVELDTVRALFEAMDEYERIGISEYAYLYKRLFIWLRSGRRRGEIISLPRKQIDIEAGDFIVKAGENKAGVDMQYPLLDDMRANLPGDDEPGEWLFESPRAPGEHIRPDTVIHHWEALLDAVGGNFRLRGETRPIRELHLHDLRHIIAGILKKGEVPDYVRSKVLGHKLPGITERYGPGYYGDIGRAQRLAYAIIRGSVPADTKWKDWE